MTSWYQHELEALDEVYTAAKGEMTRIDLRIKKVKGGPLCIGSGFIALDVIQGKAGSFSAVGGSCGNVMMILAWLGWKARPSARLGADTTGNFVLNALQDAGVDPAHLLEDATVLTPMVMQRFLKNAAGPARPQVFLILPGLWGLVAEISHDNQKTSRADHGRSST